MSKPQKPGEAVQLEGGVGSRTCSETFRPGNRKQSLGRKGVCPLVTQLRRWAGSLRFLPSYWLIVHSLLSQVGAWGCLSLAISCLSLTGRPSYRASLPVEPMGLPTSQCQQETPHVHS